MFGYRESFNISGFGKQKLWKTKSSSHSVVGHLYQKLLTFVMEYAIITLPLFEGSFFVLLRTPKEHPLEGGTDV